MINLAYCKRIFADDMSDSESQMVPTAQLYGSLLARLMSHSGISFIQNVICLQDF